MSNKNIEYAEEIVMTIVNDCECVETGECICDEMYCECSCECEACLTEYVACACGGNCSCGSLPDHSVL